MWTYKLAMLLVTCILSSAVSARDTAHLFPISDALAQPAAKEQIDPRISFHFGKKAPNTTKVLGTYTANRKTNAFNKSDKAACEWVFLSSLLALQKRAIEQGGNAVINIHSVYKNNPMHSDKDYECHAGAIIAGVALKGTVATIQ